MGVALQFRRGGTAVPWGWHCSSVWMALQSRRDGTPVPYGWNSRCDVPRSLLASLYLLVPPDRDPLLVEGTALFAIFTDTLDLHPMKIIHTADWHVGHELYGYNRE